MTRTQWAILAALGLAVVALFCIGGALILTTLSVTPKPPEEVRVIEVTATPVPVIAPATAKPIPTVQPTAQIQPPALNIFATQTAIAPTPTSTSTPNVTLTGNPEQWLPVQGICLRE